MKVTREIGTFQCNFTGLNKVWVCDDETSARSHANLFGSSNVMFKAGLNIMKYEDQILQIATGFPPKWSTDSQQCEQEFNRNRKCGLWFKLMSKSCHYSVSAWNWSGLLSWNKKERKKKENERKNGADDIFCNRSNPHVWLFAGWWMRSKKQSYFHLKCSSAQTQTASLLLKTQKNGRE